jgi:hypothetical protein
MNFILFVYLQQAIIVGSNENVASNTITSGTPNRCNVKQQQILPGQQRQMSSSSSYQQQQRQSVGDMSPPGSVSCLLLF